MNEIESAVLGTLIDFWNEPGVTADAIDINDFETGKAKKLFEIITNSASGNGGFTDLPLVLQYIADKSEHDSRLGTGSEEKEKTDRFDVADVSGKVVSPSQFGFYLERLKENRRRRDLLKALSVAQSDLNGTGNATVIENLQRKIREIYGGVKEYSTKDTLMQTLDELQADQKQGIQFSTGFDAFDETWGGIFPKELYVIAGDSGHYKTTLTLNLMKKGLREGKKVLWFDREMGRLRLMRHYLCILSGVEIWRLRKKVMREQDWTAINNMTETVANQQFILIDDVTTLPKMVEAVMRYRPDVVVIDNLQNMDFPKSDNFWTFHMGVVGIKDMAMDYGVGVVALSQVTRTPADVGSARPPTIENLFGSRAIKQNADAVAIVHWPYKDKMSEPKGIYNIYHAKMREEGTARYTMEIDPEHGTIADKGKSRRKEEHPAFAEIPENEDLY
jgi:replicative DNA helicase